MSSPPRHSPLRPEKAVRRLLQKRLRRSQLRTALSSGEITANACDSNGTTLLMAACLTLDARLVSTLAHHHADATLTDAHGATCLYYLFSQDEKERGEEEKKKKKKKKDKKKRKKEGQSVVAARLFLAAQLLRAYPRQLLCSHAPDGGDIGPWLRKEAENASRVAASSEAEAAVDLVAALRSAQAALTAEATGLAAAARLKQQGGKRRHAHGSGARQGEEDGDDPDAAWRTKLAGALADDFEEFDPDAAGFSTGTGHAAGTEGGEAAGAASYWDTMDDDAYAAELQRQMRRRYAARNAPMGPSRPIRGAAAEAERARRAADARANSERVLAEQRRLDVLRSAAARAAWVREYEARSERFFADLASAVPASLRLTDVPFPGETDEEVANTVLAAAAAEAVEEATPDELEVQRRRLLRRAQKRWHPDVWARHAAAIADADREAVLAAVQLTSQRLNRLVATCV